VPCQKPPSVDSKGNLDMDVILEASPAHQNAALKEHPQTLIPPQKGGTGYQSFPK
jgi:hypothetical protein